MRATSRALLAVALFVAGFGHCQARKARARKVKQRSAPPAAAAATARSDDNADVSRVKECAYLPARTVQRQAPAPLSVQPTPA